MVNTSLDRKYEAKEGQNTSFGVIPEGKYKVKVKEIGEWKLSKKDIKVYLKDENGEDILDDKGERATELVKNCEFYNANVRFEIVEGDYKGRLLFHNLTTHPNMSFSISNFLYAVNKNNISAAEIKKECTGLICEAVVIETTYDKKVVDKDTGVEEVKSTPKNEIRYLNRLPETQDLPEPQFTDDGEDMGI